MQRIRRQRETFCYRIAVGVDDNKKKKPFDPSSPFDTKQDLNAQREGWNPDKFNNVAEPSGPRMPKMEVTQGMGRPGQSGSGGGGSNTARPSGGGGGYSPSQFDISQFSSAEEYAQSMSGKPYNYSGAAGNPEGVDCSGYMSDIFSIYSGQPTRFTTDTDFSSLGFQPGYQEGAFNIGTNGGVGMDGHMAGTMPDGTPVESSGSGGVQYGGNAAGAMDFPQQWHYPIST